MKLLTNEQQKLCKNAKICYTCQEKFEHAKDKKYRKVRDYCRYTWKYRGPAPSICNLKYNVNKENPIVFDNGSNYDYHFIIKVEKFKKNLEE